MAHGQHLQQSDKSR